MIGFDTMFFLKGFLDQMSYTDYSVYQAEGSYKRFKPVGIVLLLVGLLITIPGNYEDVGELWVYPIYLGW